MSGSHQHKQNLNDALPVTLPVLTKIPACFRTVLPSLSLASVLICAMDHASAQAGSRPVQFYDSPQMFYHSLNGSAPERSGVGDAQPLTPVGLLALAPTVHYLLWVELEQGRLNVMENLGDDGIIVRKRIPISIGKQGIGKRQEGDNKTPIGVYRVEGFLQDAVLDDFYGNGAYPLNYPNPLDQLHGYTGHGIWLHGLPKLEAQRPFLTSEGCVVIDNESLAALADEIGAGATVVLSSQELEWVPNARQ
ncbi:MAG: L,D-transpeptidase family protein, partial [Pseudomonadota bacterium]